LPKIELGVPAVLPGSPVRKMIEPAKTSAGDWRFQV
jgi:hypothetical protein